MKITPLKMWVQNVLPVVYDDSLSYYEMVGKINEKTNEIINQVNENTDDIEMLNYVIQELGDIDELKALLEEVETIVNDLYTSDTPVMDSANGSAGVAEHAARSDHSHPSDSSKANSDLGISGAVAGQFVKIKSVELGVPTGFENGMPHEVPAGGTDGDVLVKDGVTDYAAKWERPYSRANLLDNWYFVGGGSQLGNGVFPINQRGQTIYNPNVYNIDRWQCYNSGVTVASNWISVGGNGVMTQSIENLSNYYGKTVTCSILFDDGLEYGTAILTSSDATLFINKPGFQAYISVEGGLFQFYKTAAYNVKAVKLELGSYQTLAHNEGTEANPNWVLNEIPDWNIERYKCDPSRGTLPTGGTDGDVLVKSGATDYSATWSDNIKTSLSRLNKIGVTLWTGDFVGPGALTIPDLSSYKIIAIFQSNDDVYPLIGTITRGGTLYGVYSAAGISQLAYRFNYSAENTLEVSATDQGITDGTETTYSNGSNCHIKKIIGLIPN